MPIVAAGSQQFSVSEMLEVLLDAAVHWMESGLPLDRLKIVAHSDPQANEAKLIFDAKAMQYAASVPRQPESKNDFDVFISYARENTNEVELFEMVLLASQPSIKIFLDRNSIDVGMAWQPEIFESLDRCRKVVAMFSPNYLSSKVCKEEFNIAWVRSRETDDELIFPVYLYSADLPTYMRYRNYIDCREGDLKKIEAASTQLLKALGLRV
jgi:hypothetical protein